MRYAEVNKEMRSGGNFRLFSSVSGHQKRDRELGAATSKVCCEATCVSKRGASKCSEHVNVNADLLIMV